MNKDSPYDLLIIGGGVNGCGIARDAAGRGLSVLLVEQNDLASATSSASTKLIHGGLRYLEHYEFRLVREALSERDVLLDGAPHIMWPMRFVLPHDSSLRPAWMIRAGLFLYDHLGWVPGRKSRLPGSHKVALPGSPYGRGSSARRADRLRLFRRLGRRCTAGRTCRTARGRSGCGYPRAHASDRRAPRERAVACRAVRPHCRPEGRSSCPRDRQCGRPLGDADPVGGSRLECACVDQARERQPYRRAAPVRGRTRFHPAERRQAHHLRDPLSRAIHADRHDRGRPRRRSVARLHHAGRDGVSVQSR